MTNSENLNLSGENKNDATAPTQSEAALAASPARNEPCPCGSGKKYKRCHGVAAAPKITPPKPGGLGAGGMPPGMENMDPAMMSQAAQMLQRLPKGQLAKLQSIMQRAMAGKDVTREAEEFQKTLPPDFQQMMTSFAAMAGMANANAGGAAEGGMSEEEARAIVAKAAEEGKLSEEQAKDLLTESPKTSSGLGKLWKSVTGK